MPYVIAEPCVATCNTDCVDVCPVDCIGGLVPVEALRALSESERRARFPALQLFIDPDTCTSCGACASACPVSAVFDEDDLPAEWARYKELNAAHFRR